MENTYFEEILMMVYLDSQDKEPGYWRTFLLAGNNAYQGKQLTAAFVEVYHALEGLLRLRTGDVDAHLLSLYHKFYRGSFEWPSFLESYRRAYGQIIVNRTPENVGITEPDLRNLIRILEQVYRHRAVKKNGKWAQSIEKTSVQKWVADWSPYAG